jgi:hypothetical protein
MFEKLCKLEQDCKLMFCKLVFVKNKNVKSGNKIWDHLSKLDINDN